MTTTTTTNILNELRSIVRAILQNPSPVQPEFTPYAELPDVQRISVGRYDVEGQLVTKPRGIIKCECGVKSCKHISAVRQFLLAEITRDMPA